MIERWVALYFNIHTGPKRHFKNVFPFIHSDWEWGWGYLLKQQTILLCSLGNQLHWIPNCSSNMTI